MSRSAAESPHETVTLRLCAPVSASVMMAFDGSSAVFVRVIAGGTGSGSTGMRRSRSERSEQDRSPHCCVRDAQ